MASYSATLSTHQTAASGVADTVTLDKDYGEVEVVNRDGAGEIFFTLDGTTPTIGLAGTYMLPAAICSKRVTSVELASDATVVKLIASATTKYSVEGHEQ